MSTNTIRALPIAHTVHRNGYSGPAWELPATAEAYERMVEQVSKAIWRDSVFSDNTALRNAYRPAARAALRAIGITPPKKGQP